MELLVATLASTQNARDSDAQAHMRQVTDTVKNAVGLMTARLYRGREQNSQYILLTTWEDEEGWQKAREQFDPHMHVQNAGDLLAAPPEQWLMHYQWGYSRPARSPQLSTIHIAAIHPQQADMVQQAWLQGLHRQTLTPSLAFAFLARGMDREATEPRRIFKIPGEPRLTPQDATQHGSVLLSFFSWGSELERETFYASPDYLMIQQSIERIGIMRVFSLELL